MFDRMASGRTLKLLVITLNLNVSRASRLAPRASRLAPRAASSAAHCSITKSIKLSMSFGSLKRFAMARL
jgi:hypothetical protein